MTGETSGCSGMLSLLGLVCILGVAVGGVLPSTASAAEPMLLIDATADPGIDLLVTFIPQSSVAGGIRRIAAHQTVVTMVPIRLGAVLPTSWMVSVRKAGDAAANVSAIPISDRSGRMVFAFPDEMDVIYSDGDWQIPNFDSRSYVVEVGFGIGSDLVQWAYSVPCRPGQRFGMAPGNYQIVRSDGDDTTGTPIRTGLEAWTIPSDTDSTLTFDSRGRGTINPSR